MVALNKYTDAAAIRWDGENQGKSKLEAWPRREPWDLPAFRDWVGEMEPQRKLKVASEEIGSQRPAVLEMERVEPALSSVDSTISHLSNSLRFPL